MSRSLDKDPLYQQLLFSLPMREGSGTVGTADVAKPHHPVTLTHSPAWTQVGPNNLWVLSLDGLNDYLVCAGASCTDLNFVAEDFSGCIWVYPSNSPNYTGAWLLGRGAYPGDGWAMWVGSEAPGYRNNLTTIQGATVQQSYGTTRGVPVSAWSLIGFTRVGASVRLYQDGRDDTATTASHVNPTTSANDLGIGKKSATSYYKGYLWNPRVWGRALKPDEHKQLFDRERKLFNV